MKKPLLSSKGVVGIDDGRDKRAYYIYTRRSEARGRHLPRLRSAGPMKPREIGARDSIYIDYSRRGTHVHTYTLFKGIDQRGCAWHMCAPAVARSKHYTCIYTHTHTRREFSPFLSTLRRVCVCARAFSNLSELGEEDVWFAGALWWMKYMSGVSYVGVIVKWSLGHVFFYCRVFGVFFGAVVEWLSLLVVLVGDKYLRGLFFF